MFPPEIASALAKNDVAVLEPFFNKLQGNTTQRFILGRGMWVHGATTRWEYFKILQAYSLADIAKNIQCPTFVAEAENDRRRGGGKDLYNALRCPKECVLFTASEGAGEHCEAGAREVFVQKMFGWFDPVMPGEHVANDAAHNVIETYAHKGRVVRFDDCKEIASSRGIRYELSTAAAARF